MIYTTSLCMSDCKIVSASIQHCINKVLRKSLQRIDVFMVTALFNHSPEMFPIAKKKKKAVEMFISAFIIVFSILYMYLQNFYHVNLKKITQILIPHIINSLRKMHLKMPCHDIPEFSGVLYVLLQILKSFSNLKPCMSKIWLFENERRKIFTLVL